MKEKIRDFIATELINRETAAGLSFGEDLLAEGMIDSMGIMRLISFIESEFDVVVPPQDMVIENFMSIERIDSYLAGRSA